jgi:putative restriction endonuclease
MNDKWTREETIVAFNVYCKIPFQDSRSTHPMIIKFAGIIGRSPAALNMKIGNIGRFDPKLRERGIVGLSHGSRMEQEIWEEFNDNPDKLIFESECLIEQFTQRNLGSVPVSDIKKIPIGKERLSLIKQRVNQSFFRMAVLSSYNFRCCISGIGNLELLDACHIVDWVEDKGNRCNPENGLCMNTLFHKAYDNYLMAITPEYDIVISDQMIEEAHDQSFLDYISNINNKKLMLPTRFYPEPRFLDIHYQKYLNKNK